MKPAQEFTNSFRRIRLYAILAAFIAALSLLSWIAPRVLGQAANSAVASVGDSVEMTSQMWALMTLRDLPQLMDDKFIMGFASAQVSNEQDNWRMLGPQTGPDGNLHPPRPSITYEWQKLMTEQPDLASGPLLDVFLSNNPSWSFLDKNPKWNPKGDPTVVEVFLFSKDKIDKRPADAAARELLPVVKQNFQMAIKKLPAHYYFNEDLPAAMYDPASKRLRFNMPNGPADTFELMFPMVNNLTGKGKEMTEYAIGPVVQTQMPPEKNPGTVPPYGNASEWEWKQNFTRADIPQPVVWALDRQVRLTNVPLDGAQANTLAKLTAGLKARVFYTADHIELETPSAPLSRTTRTVLFAHLEKVQIIDRNGGLITTLDAQSFAAPAPATPAPPPANDPAAKKNAACVTFAQSMSGTTNPQNSTYQKVFGECMARQ